MFHENIRLHVFGCCRKPCKYRYLSIGRDPDLSQCCSAFVVFPRVKILTSLGCTFVAVVTLIVPVPWHERCLSTIKEQFKLTFDIRYASSKSIRGPYSSCVLMLYYDGVLWGVRSPFFVKGCSARVLGFPPQIGVSFCSHSVQKSIEIFFWQPAARTEMIHNKMCSHTNDGEAFISWKDLQDKHLTSNHWYGWMTITPLLSICLSKNMLLSILHKHIHHYDF